ncbi:MAG: histidine--tRNA ligase [Cyclobacteriaceae bacterium]
MEKPTLPKGTRDFGPAQMAKRQFILNTIRQVFQKYGFQPLETPAMENLTTLTGKYGVEGDQLLFKILNSGDFLKNFKSYLMFPNELSSSRSIFKDIARESKKQNFKTFDICLKSLKITLYKGDEIFEKIDEFYSQNSGVVESVYRNLTEGFISEEEFTDQIDLLFRNFATQYLLKRLTPSELVFNQSISLSEKGLRYDLTVPFARYVVMNRNEVTFPFKRYQIQPVWRADRPQKGRYREFYQCDADVVGTDSLICEAEIVLMIKEVFKGLGIADFSIKINHRGILSGLAELCAAKDQPAGQAGNESSLFVAIDKLDKIGEEKVKEELRSRGFSETSLSTLFEIVNFKGTTQQKIEFLSNKFSTTPTGQKGVSDFKAVLNLLSGYGATEEHVEFDIALARGLSYYTGCIFEVTINNVSIGSVSGGGRYDNLTGVFGLPGVSGVGFSFGVDRLYDAMEELKLFPQEAQISSKVLIAHFDAESQRYGLKVLQTLRANGIASEIYPDSVKIQKQLDYANKKLVPYSIVIGSEEVKSGLLAFKNMKTGEQTKSGIDDILKTLK